METSICCHNDFYNLQLRIRCMACIWEGYIVWIPQLTYKNSSQTEMVFLRNGDMPGPFPPFICGWLPHQKMLHPPKFQYLHKFLFDGHHGCPFQVQNQILDHFKIPRKLTEHSLSACSALGTVLCALAFPGMCKCSDMLFFLLY